MNDVFLNIMQKKKENYVFFFSCFFVLHVLHHLIIGCLMLAMTHLSWLLTSSMFHGARPHECGDIWNVQHDNDGKSSKSLVRVIWFTWQGNGRQEWKDLCIYVLLQGYFLDCSKLLWRPNSPFMLSCSKKLFDILL
jgi:hypothetical protein